MSFKKTVFISLLLLGFTAMLAQVVFMRELLVVFYGNELSIGIMLAGWLLWGAVGSYASVKFRIARYDKARIYSICQSVLAVILPVTLLFIRSSRGLLGISIGEMIGYIPMMIIVFTGLSAASFLMGAMFSLGCRVWSTFTEDPFFGVAKVYVLEAIGALAGGLLGTYFLIRNFPPMYILVVLGFVNFALSIIMRHHCAGKENVIFRKRIGNVILLIAAAAVFFSGGKYLEDFSAKLLWKGFKVKASENSVYGNIVITEQRKQHSIYENGLHLYTVPDRFSAENTAHLALLETKSPERVLLIGGGMNGTLSEILEHPVKEIDYLELDPTIITMAEKYLPETKGIGDEKVNVINLDARFFIKQVDKKYDCVIIDLGDPYTAQINRFYTVDFFREINRKLRPGGVVSFSVTSSENYVGEELKRYLGSLYISLKKVFPDVLVLPGDRAYFLASNKKGMLTYDPKVLSRRIQERMLDTKYIREPYLIDRFSEERVIYLNDLLNDAASEMDVNSDFRPISNYYATSFWSTHFDEPFFRKILFRIREEWIWLLTVLICLAMLFFSLAGRKRGVERIVLLAVMTTGFFEIIVQIAVILSFQAIYGYVFYKLGIIIASFMAGLAVGGILIEKRIGNIRDYVKIFILVQVGICLYSLVLPFMFKWLSLTDSPVMSWLGSNILLTFIPIIAGIMGGIQFPLANKICAKDISGAGEVVGVSYGLDLAGACVGSLLAAAVLIPVLGIVGTCMLTALVNLTVLAALKVS